MEFLAFEFALTEPSGPVEDDLQRLSAVVGDLRMFVGGQACYRDVAFPIVEFAVALWRWLSRVEETGEDFVFTARPFPQTLIRIFPGHQGWHVTSVQMELPPPNVFGLGDLVVQIREFLEAVEERVEAAHGFSVRALADALESRS